MCLAAKTTKELVVVVVMGHFLVIVLIIVGHCGSLWAVLASSLF